MHRYIFLPCSMVLAVGCNVESPPVTDKAPSVLESAGKTDETDDSWTITGEVVDENGLLVVDFDAAVTWSSNGVYWNEAGQVPSDEDALRAIWKQEGVLAVRPTNLAATTSNGTFSLTIKGRRDAAVFAVNKDRTRGGLVLVERNAADRPVRIELNPLVSVTAEIFCHEAGKSPEWCMAEVYPIGGDNIPLTMCGTYQGKVSFLLPAGKYEITATGEELPSRRIRITIPDDVEKFDAGVIELKLPRDTEGNPVNINDFYGKNPPDLEITDARAVPKGVQLKDFRGKWVLLEFWAVWCGPCVGGSIPWLCEFYEQNAAFRDRFEILAICDTSSEKVKTNGNVRRVIQSFRWQATHQRLEGKQLADMERICGFFERNADKMKYDQYLAKGYPIATGFIEGGCRHVIKDRMERSGMRWSVLGAQNMLYLRCIDAGDLWRTFDAVHQKKTLDAYGKRKNFITEFQLAA